VTRFLLGDATQVQRAPAVTRPPSVSACGATASEGEPASLHTTARRREILRDVQVFVTSPLSDVRFSRIGGCEVAKTRARKCNESAILHRARGWRGGMRR
jgi:hypothetical protein